MCGYRRPAMINWVDSEDGTTLLDLRSGRYYRLNVTASMIWRGLIEGKGPDEIVRILLTHHKLPELQLKRDLVTFIDKLVQLGYIQQVLEGKSTADFGRGSSEASITS
jgi:hypothetical protein